jgi:hypothetical protein
MKNLINVTILYTFKVKNRKKLTTKAGKAGGNTSLKKSLRSTLKNLAESATQGWLLL